MSYAMRMTGRVWLSEVQSPLSCFVCFGGGSRGFSLFVTSDCCTDGGKFVGLSGVWPAGGGCSDDGDTRGSEAGSEETLQLSCFVASGGGSERFSLFIPCDCDTVGDDFFPWSSQVRLTGCGCLHLSKFSCFAGVGSCLEVFLLPVSCGVGDGDGDEDEDGDGDEDEDGDGDGDGDRGGVPSLLRLESGEE